MAAQVTCPYITTLERACGRASTHGEHCGFHAVLHDFETQPFVDLNTHVQRLYDAIGALSK